MRKSGILFMVIALFGALFTVAFAEERQTEYNGCMLTYFTETDELTGEVYAVISSAEAVTDLIIPGEVDGIPVRVIGAGTRDEFNIQSGNYLNNYIVKEHQNRVKTLMVEDGCSTISRSAFEGLTKLEKVIFPNTLEIIGQNAFYETYSLKEIRLSGNFQFENLYWGAFKKTGLEDVVKEDGSSYRDFLREKYTDNWIDEAVWHITTYDKRWEYLLLEDNTVLIISCHPKKKEYVEILIPEELHEHRVNSIYRDFISSSYSITAEDIVKVILPEGLTSIGEKAFLECQNLEDITFPESLEDIGFAAFAGVGMDQSKLPTNTWNDPHNLWYCSEYRIDISGNFKYGLLPDGTAAIVELLNPQQERKIVIPSELDGIPVAGVYKITDIYSQRGINYPIITNVIVSEGIREIGDYAFSDCVSLKDIKLPQSLRGIGRYAFSNCYSLKSIQLPKSLEQIDDYAFLTAGITSITIPESVTKIGVRLFLNSALNKISFPKAWDVIPKEICYGAINLKTVTLPSNIIKIDEGSFFDCYRLTSVKFSEGLTTIGKGAFQIENDFINENREKTGGKKTFSALKKVNFPATLITIEEDAFNGCDALSSFTFSKNTQISYIGDRAFASCYSLKEVNLPDALLTIGKHAFKNCLSLKKANLGNSAMEIGEGTFMNDTALTSLIVPNTVIKIGENLLENVNPNLTVQCGEESDMNLYLQENYPNVSIISGKY